MYMWVADVLTVFLMPGLLMSNLLMRVSSIFIDRTTGLLLEENEFADFGFAGFARARFVDVGFAGAGYNVHKQPCSHFPYFTHTHKTICFNTPFIPSIKSLQALVVTRANGGSMVLALVVSGTKPVLLDFEMSVFKKEKGTSDTKPKPHKSIHNGTKEDHRLSISLLEQYTIVQKRMKKK